METFVIHDRSTELYVNKWMKSAFKPKHRVTGPGQQVEKLVKKIIFVVIVPIQKYLSESKSTKSGFCMTGSIRLCGGILLAEVIRC